MGGGADSGHSGWVGDLVDTHSNDHRPVSWSVRPGNGALFATTWVTVSHALRHLLLQWLARVTALPDLGRNTSLRRVDLVTMKGLRDLRPLATAPALEEVALHDMRRLAPADVRTLLDCPALTRVAFSLGSARKNREARALLGLPDIDRHFDWRTES